MGDLGAPIKGRTDLLDKEMKMKENEHSREGERLKVSCEGTTGSALEYDVTLYGWEASIIRKLGLAV